VVVEVVYTEAVVPEQTLVLQDRVLEELYE
jgi:hypothetical protein